VRFVLCDDDRMLVPMVESLLTRLGHEIVGEADDTATAAQLVIAARPDAVIVDPALGYNTDFDVIEAAIEVGAATVVFTHTADEAQMSHYPCAPRWSPSPTSWSSST
jgi:DNA-binding NarL/FixJ family response regulator